VAEKPVIESKHHLRPDLANLHLLVGSWSLWGIAFVYVWLERSGQKVYTFLIRILSTSLTSASIFSAAALGMYLCGYSGRT